MVRLATRLRSLFWVWLAFLLVQTLLLLLFSRRALRRSDTALNEVAEIRAAVSSSLNEISANVGSVVEWVHDYADGQAASAGASGSAAAPLPPRVLGAGQNGKYLYMDVEYDDGYDKRVERRYIRLPSLKDSSPVGESPALRNEPQSGESVAGLP